MSFYPQHDYNHNSFALHVFYPKFHIVCEYSMLGERRNEKDDKSVGLYSCSHAAVKLLTYPTEESYEFLSTLAYANTILLKSITYFGVPRNWFSFGMKVHTTIFTPESSHYDIGLTLTFFMLTR